MDVSDFECQKTSLVLNDAGHVTPPFAQISDLDNEKHELERTVNELKAKCEAIEKREAERRQVEEKKHSEEIQFLKRTNQQLKVQAPRREYSH